MSEDRYFDKWRIYYRPLGGRWGLASWNKGPAIFGSNGEALEVLYKMERLSDAGFERRILIPYQSPPCAGG